MSSRLFGVLITWPIALVIKITIVLGVAACLAFVLRRAAASTQHLVWLAAVIASLGLAVASPIVPALDVAVKVRTPMMIPVVLEVPRGFASTRPRVVAPMMAARERFIERAIRRIPPSDTFDLNPRYFIAGAWLVGFLIVIGRCIAGHLAVARLVSRARPVTSFEWRESIDDAIDTVCVSRNVSVLISDDIAAPVTSGALRPVVLLPSDATLWTEERRAVVLIHELAHIARFDYVAQLVATIVCALFWFHPLAWFAAARLRAEAEHAADDCVLVAGTPGVSYASHLLDLARVEHSPHFSAAVAVGMVKASRLEGRFRAMLDANRSRSALSPSVQAMATSLTLAAMVPFAGLRAVVAPSPVAFWRVPSVTTTRVVDQVQTADPLSIGVLYTQPDFRASAMSSDGSAFGVVYPRTANAGDPQMLELRGVPKRAELKPGTMIFTSGLGSVFPRGIAIGTVVQELKTAEVWTRTYLLRPVVLPSRVNAVAGTLPEISAADSTIEKTIDAAPGERLVLDLQTGGSIVLRGWDEPRVRVRARLAGDDWRDTRVSLERTNRGIRLTSEFSGSASNRSTRHAFELWVPRGINVELSSAGGSVAISDVTGEFRGHTGGGSLVIEGASGNARLTTGGGDVRVSNSRLAGSVSTGGGEVVISNVSGSLVGSSGSGPVITTGVGSGIGQNLSVAGKATSVSGAVSVAGRGDDATTIVRGTAGYGYGFGSGTGTTVASTATAGSGAVRTVITGQGGFGTTSRAYTGPIRLSLSKAGGDIVMDSVEDGARLSTGGGRISIGSANGFLSVSTGGGDIDLPRVGGDVSASTGSGDVTITVVNANGSEHSVDVFTGHGRLVLELPADLDARFELETAYTKRPTSIDSDFPLTQSETNDWDDSQGTPRKYVRARGTVGTGRGLIRVRVVNGDIVVRRTGG